jgi:peptidyl-prolyl cis-trans isomerase A (cyclophilin A)
MLPGISKATVVTMETTMGNINIELFDSVTPMTVTNFLNYVQDGDYVNSFIHRSVPGFIIQGGGFQYDADIDTFNSVPTDAPIVNESSLSNVRGTLAMATQTGDPNSATSQWFFNLIDNYVLDTQNGGFTVFGQVLGNGMDIVDAIAALPTYDQTSINPAFTDLPLNGYDGITFDPANELVQIKNVSVVPIPAAWLFGSGLVGLVAMARLKKT